MEQEAQETLPKALRGEMAQIVSFQALPQLVVVEEAVVLEVMVELVALVVAAAAMAPVVEDQELQAKETLAVLRGVKAAAAVVVRVQ